MSNDTEGVKVVLDIHEPSTLHTALQNHPDVADVKLAPLDAADISIGGVGFERKDWGDYVSTMKGEGERSFEDQDAKMEAYDVAYVLVEGDMADTESLLHTSMAPESIRGHAASLTAREEYHVQSVIPCSNIVTMADYAVRLARKHTEDPTTEYLPTGAVGKNEPPGKKMWGCLPRVGPELADRLWQHFDGSPAQFARTVRGDPVVELREVDGIGLETAEDIWVAMTERP